MERYKTMSKELEALEILCGEIVEMDLLFTDRNGENQNKWLKSEAFAKLKEFDKKYGSPVTVLQNALQRLEAIDNANPSEALTYIDAFIEENNNDIKNQDITGFDIDTQAKWVKYLEHKSFMLSTIKQALLKAQEPKHYLKWEDLEFKEKTSRIEVKLNETLYSLSCVKRQYLDFVYLINNDSQIRLNSANDIQFFNDLHLERVEE